MTILPRLPLAVSSWAQVNAEGLSFIDQTAQLVPLVQRRKVFIAAPRRMGKSFICAQLHELYAHGPERFADTQVRTIWRERAAVVHLKFSTVPPTADFERNLCLRLTTAFAAAGVAPFLPCDHLVELTAQLELLCAERDLVVLIDEWDKPLAAKSDPQVVALLNAFYAWLSSLPQLRFLLITGIMHYRETEVFLGPDVRDLSAELPLGFTPEELERDYGAYLDEAALRLGLSRAQLLTELTQHYCHQGRYCPWLINQFLEPLTLDAARKPQFLAFS